MFRDFDEDRNGTIDRQELTRGLTALSTGISTAQADDFFDILDQNGDGEIDYTEFARLDRRPALTTKAQ